MPSTQIRGNQITNYTVDTEQLSNTAIAAFAQSLEPKILYANVASNTFTVLDDTSVNVGGGYIVVTGAEFQSGATVLIDTTPATSVSYIDNNTLRAQVPAKSAASYNLYVVNPDGGIGIKPAGITYSSVPSWVTTSPLTNVSSNSVFSGTFSATGATSYANTTILPTGFTLLSNGYYYGNISVDVTTTYSFDIAAIDSELQDSTKTFSLTAVTALPYSVDYLVVAGGGAGGAGHAGGGGAGGLLQGTTTLIPGSLYTISVGAGGTALGPPSTGVSNFSPIYLGESGSSSNIASLAPGFTTITAGGGGGGAGYNPGNASPGGSGGGGSTNNGTTGSLGGSGTPGQGNSGGNGTPSWNSPAYGCGGGGGAGGAGISGSTSSGGTGGNGYTWPYTGSTYAGGGGGATYGQPGPNQVPGGTGGGGRAGTSGTPQTGGGGGGGFNNFTNAGSGGSGVIILAIPTPAYPGSAPGATVTTPPAAPGKTVLTYNSSGIFTS